MQVSLQGAYEGMESDSFAILSTYGGAGDFFILPIRISKILGWAAAHSYISNICSINVVESADLFGKISKFIIDNYLSSIVSVSDCQSPYLLCAFSELQRNELNDIYEIIFGSMFSSYISCQGLVADARISPEKIPEFLFRRNSQNISGAREIYAQPDELLAVFLYAANNLKLNDVVDPYLEEIDHHMFNVFLPADHTQFSAASVRNGINATFQIGYEHGLGVFKTSDFYDGWVKSCVPALDSEPRKESQAVKIATLLSAFLFPDRVPWLTFCREID